MDPSDSATSQHETSNQEGQVELGPFQPPVDFDPGKEFMGAPPRSVPKGIVWGPYTRQWIARILTAAWTCFLFVFLSGNRYIKEISYYILPLGYLNYIGWGILAITLVVACYSLFRLSGFKYVIHGHTLPGRILGYSFYANREGEARGFAVGVECRHPETGDIVEKLIRTYQFMSGFTYRKYSLSVTPGDYVTLVYLPGKFDTSLQIYGLLRVNPSVDFVRKNGKPLAHKFSLLFPIAWAMGITLLLGIFVGLSYGFFASPFLETPFGTLTLGALAGGVLFGAVFWGAILILRALKPEFRPFKTKESRTRAAFLPFLAGLCCAPVSMIHTNSSWDSSPPEYREVEVVEFWQTTYNYIVRDYSIEYEELKPARKGRFPATVAKMRDFYVPKAGMLVVRSGRWGWAWCEDILPVVPVEPAEESKKEVGLAVELPDGSRRPLSPELERRVRERLRQLPETSGDSD